MSQCKDVIEPFIKEPAAVFMVYADRHMLATFFFFNLLFYRVILINFLI
jgi:hypothetical protein